MKLKKRPILLYVLAALSSIYLFFGIYSELTYLTNKEHFQTEYFVEAEEKIMGITEDSEEAEFTRDMLKAQVVYRTIDNENYVRNHTTLLFIHLVGIFGVMFMFKLNFKGFGLYVTYVVLDILFRSYAYNQTPNFDNFLMMNGLLSLAFVSGYYSIFYKIKKQNNNV